MYEMKEEKVVWIALEETSSTNDYAKARMGEKRNIVVTAKRQSKGRGTKGRTFSSETGGVYLSFLRFYEHFPASRAFEIMIGAAVAVCETVASYGVEPQIKWPNDVWVQGKKLCGILIENTLSGRDIAASIVGVGLNVNNELPEELLQTATTLQQEKGAPFSVSEVTERLIAALRQPWGIEDYRKYLGYMGECATLIFGDERIPATLLRVTDEGKLVAEIDGTERELSSAEVSIKL